MAEEQAARIKKELVVDIPVNRKAQELIVELRKNMAGLDAVLGLYDRYAAEDDYKKVVYIIQNLCSNIGNLAFAIREIKPELMEI